jgi:exonuclease III
MSGINENRAKKIVSIMDLDKDIILLSDLRLLSLHNVKILEDQFRFRYRLLVHSTKAKRGVAILIKNNVDLTIISEFRDNDENILLLLCSISGTEFLIGSIYGSNTDDTPFFEDLDNFLDTVHCDNIILGGDWNTTLSSLPVEANPDVFKMKKIPSKKRTDTLNDIIDKFNLLDIFRLLHGNRRDYTYLPYSNKTNRSRLDYFLVSEPVAEAVKYCASAELHNKRLFDHKAVILNTGKIKRRGRATINNRIIGHPLLIITNLLAIYECFIANYSTLCLTMFYDHFSTICSRLDDLDAARVKLLDYCGPWQWRADLTPAQEIEKNNLLLEADRIISELPDVNEMYNFKCALDDDLFFEEIISCTKAATIKLQVESGRSDNNAKAIIIAELKSLKTNFALHSERISQLENKLSSIVEGELNDKLSNYLKTEIVNGEKITPRFLNLAKSRVADNINQIRNDDGSPFDNASERNEFIRSFYESLYKVPDELKNVEFEGCIEKFLGNDIVNNPIVAGMKLSAEERDQLDSPLTLDELDLSLKDSNMNSAPGIDGVSNKFIKKIWHLVRVGLLRYANCCFNKGQLTNTFKQACIKLIPKKGDTTKIKNWRPISLLSCYYKVISRVINMRLGKVINKVTSRGQKAYAKGKFIHEVTINLTNAIEFCLDTGTPGAIISVDQQKAFDSLLHGFCTEAYKFFGFGDNFINMMETLGNNRTACIILENGELSDSFSLERGRAQGDGPSPRQYNIGEQILLLKLEFDPGIDKLGLYNDLRTILPDPDRNGPDPVIGGEVTGINVTEKTDAFADDTNVLTKQKVSNFERIKLILAEFSMISGLKCNLEKTFVLLIGPVDESVAEKIKDLGFTVVDSIKCLGVTHRNVRNSLSTNFDGTITKMKKIAGDWGRFRLSLIGRISIAKTFLVSQVTYLGEIVTPGQHQLEEMQGIVDNFVLRGTPWSKNKLYLKPREGGLGLINLSSFLVALKSSWFKRIFRFGYVDTWRARLMMHSQFDINCFREGCWNAESTIETNLGSAFWSFLLKFWSTGNNIRHSPVFLNPLVSIGPTNTGVFNPEMLGINVLGAENFRNNRKKILTFVISDFFNDGQFRDYNAINDLLGFRINFAKYFLLRNAINFAVRKFSSGTNTPIKLNNILSGRSGSRRLRSYLDSAGDNHLGMNVIQNFAEIVGVALPSNIICESSLCLWKIHYLPLEIRLFAMQWYRNSLPVMARMGNRYRNENLDQRCRLCKIGMSGAFFGAGAGAGSGAGTGTGITSVIARETFKHYFWECEFSNKLLCKFFELYYINVDAADYINLFYWASTDLTEQKLSDRIVMLLLAYEIWSARTKKIIPSITTVDRNMYFNARKIFDGYRKQFIVILLNSNSWFRKWWPGAQHGE